MDALDPQKTYNTARELLVRSEPAAAHPLFEQLHQWSIEHKDAHWEAMSARELSNIVRMKDPERAFVLLQQALTIFERLGEMDQVALVHGNLANIFRILSNRDLAIEHYEKAIAMLRIHAGESDLTTALGNYAGMLYEYNLRNQAEEVLTEAVVHARNLPNPSHLVWVLSFSAKELSNDNKMEAAFERANEAYELIDELSDAQMKASVHESLGYINNSAKNYTAAIKHYNQALPHYRSISDYRMLGAIYSYLGSVYMNIQLYDEAEKSILEALSYCHQISDLRSEAGIMSIYGQICFETGKNEESYRHHLRSLELYRNLNHRYMVAVELYSLAEVAFEQDDKLIAEANLKQAIEYGLAINSDLVLVNSYVFDAEIKLGKSDYEGAERSLATAQQYYEILNPSDKDAYIHLVRCRFLYEKSRSNPNLKSEWRNEYAKLIASVDTYSVRQSCFVGRKIIAFRKQIVADGIPEAELSLPQCWLN